MHGATSSTRLLASFLLVQQAYSQLGQPCSLAGPTVLPATKLAANPLVNAALPVINSEINAVIAGSQKEYGTLAGGLTSFSLGVFPTSDGAGTLLSEKHHNAP